MQHKSRLSNLSKADILAAVWHMLEALASAAAVLGFWVVVLFVIPGVIALYVARLFPLTGQWRKRWRERRARGGLR